MYKTNHLYTNNYCRLSTNKMVGLCWLHLIHNHVLYVASDVGHTINQWLIDYYSGTSVKGPSEKGTTTLQGHFQYPQNCICNTISTSEKRTRDQMVGPKVTFTQRFHCIILVYLTRLDLLLGRAWVSPSLVEKWVRACVSVAIRHSVNTLYQRNKFEMHTCSHTKKIMVTYLIGLDYLHWVTDCYWLYMHWTSQLNWLILQNDYITR